MGRRPKKTLCHCIKGYVMLCIVMLWTDPLNVGV